MEGVLLIAPLDMKEFFVNYPRHKGHGLVTAQS